MNRLAILLLGESFAVEIQAREIKHSLVIIEPQTRLRADLLCPRRQRPSGRRLGYFQFAKDVAGPNRRALCCEWPISERNQGEPRSLLASGRDLTQPVQP